VVLAAVALLGTLRFVPESSHPGAPSLDQGGALLAMVGLVALVFSIIEAPEAGWLAARTLGGIAGGLAVLAAFVGWELRQPHPMLDPRHFRSLRLSAGSLSIFIQFFAFFGFTFVMLQYLQGVRGDSPLVAALSVLPLAATMMPTARITPKLTAEQQGVGSALNDLSREVGGALGIAVVGSIVTAVYRANLSLTGVPAGLAGQARGSFALAIHAGGPLRASASSAFVDGIHAGLLYAAGAALLAAVTVAMLLTSDLRHRHPARSRATSLSGSPTPSRSMAVTHGSGADTELAA
jgi:hypothetical protein